MTSSKAEEQHHTPVLYQEIIHALRPTRDAFYVDGTVGAGGHAAGILAASSPTGRLLGLDLDPQALSLARERLMGYGNRAVLVNASYVDIASQISALKWPLVNGVLLDLGLSSMQLDDPGRGFSFREDGPLDMRFSPDNPVTAENLVNDLEEQGLADLIYQFGEERRSRRIARAIVRNRPIAGTAHLAAIIRKVMPRGTGQKRHPATRTFQALRMAVNRELDSVRQVMPEAIRVLAPGGRLAIISFHSLEDRLVKQFFKNESQDCICPAHQPICSCDHKATLEIVTKRPIRPSESEMKRNPRARSARLRIVIKV
jgi:16S rRNA (cytosine1402-N4)-methyltransferase